MLDTTVTLIVDGTPVTLRTNDRGTVVWSDRWELIHRVEAAGFLTHKHYGPATFGHVDYFLTPAALRADVGPELSRERRAERRTV